MQHIAVGGRRNSNIAGAEWKIPKFSGKMPVIIQAIAPSVNAEVLDVLNVDTFSEPGQGAPPATPTAREMLHYMNKMWRNKSETTATTIKLYDDAGTTCDQKNTISDDATTFTKGEYGTGP